MNYCTARDTTACLESALQLQTPSCTSFSIVVVDNHSPDESWNLINGWLESKSSSVGRELTLFPIGASRALSYECTGKVGIRVVFIEALQNSGYASGVNIGLRYAQFDPAVTHVWMLNADTILQVNSLTPLFRAVEETPESIFGSTLLYADNPAIVQAAGGAVYMPLIGRGRHCGKMKRLSEIENAQYSFDYIIGAAMFCSREVLERIGLIPEEFFLYFEELEWCRRAQDDGIRLRWVPESKILHKEGSSTGAGARFKSLSDVSFFYVVRNSFAYTWSRHRLCFMSVFLYNLFETIRYVVKGETHKWPLLLKALLEYPRVFAKVRE